jgi:hypothetical protein
MVIFVDGSSTSMLSLPCVLLSNYSKLYDQVVRGGRLDFCICTFDGC